MGVQRACSSLLWGSICLSPLLAGSRLPLDDGAQLASVFQQQVDRKLDLPEGEQPRYADLLAESLGPQESQRPQYVVLVDRNRYVQAVIIFWISPDGAIDFIGASPASTGKPGKFEHFVTPSGVFEHTVDNPDFRSHGTFNEFGIRGYGRKDMRVYDFWMAEGAEGLGRQRRGNLTASNARYGS